MIKRRKTREIKVGNVKIGGGEPVVIQSMTKTDTRDVIKTAGQIKELEAAGCQIVRVAIKDVDAAKAISAIKQRVNIPVVADIHFDYKLALLAIQNGADKIRINPGNMTKINEVEAVVRAAKSKHIPIRIGANSGSIGAKLKGLKDPAMPMVKAVLNYVKIFEKLKFDDIIISLKASDVVTTVEAYRIISRKCNYPLHLGVTAAGSTEVGIVRSSIGIGTLLMEGIGDTIRVSLTGDPVLEVCAAKEILQAAGLGNFGPQVFSCPTCGRCQVDLAEITDEFKKKLGAVGKKLGNINIAIMGCEVNGPGEAMDADIGIAAGKNSGMLFKKGKPIRKISEKDFVKVLLEEIEKL